MDVENEVVNVDVSVNCSNLGPVAYLIYSPVVFEAKTVKIRQLAHPMKQIMRQAGFNLLELMIIIGILGILAGVSLPSFMDVIGRMSANSATRTLVNSLNLARSEAIKRGTTVTLCATTDGADCAAGSWNSGWMLFVDNNNDADGAVGSVDSGDDVIQVFDPLADSNVTFTTNMFQYSGRGISLSGVSQTLKICPEDNNADNARSIILGVTGRPRVEENGLVCP